MKHHDRPVAEIMRRHFVTLAPSDKLDLADDVMKRAQARGWGQRGFPIAALVLEAMAGVELRAAGFKYEGGYRETDPRRG